MKRITRVYRYILFGIVSTSVAAGCVDVGETPEAGAPPASEQAVPVAGTVGTIQQSLDGQNGVLTVTSADQIVNQYAVLAADVAAGATSITVTDIGDFKAASSLFASGLAAGDLIMIYQPQGATIGAPEDESYGKVEALNGAGNYELVYVASVAVSTIRLDTGCKGLKYAYTVAGATEVIRVPRLTTLTIAAAGSVTAQAWDGARGGVVVVQAKTSMTVDGAIDANGKGFRGGAIDNASQDPPGTTTFRSTNLADGAEKGESIAGYQATYDTKFNGKIGRGAPANGGGGGDAHNAGGGGGANGDNARQWSGRGVMVMDANVVSGATAWTLDPDFMVNGAATDSSGGGRGGYTFSQSKEDASKTGPDDANWRGDHRRSVGGFGGHPVTNDPATHLFLGGGGGAGDGNNGSAGAGGRGGGLIVLIADRVSGAGMIQSNGADGETSVGIDNFGDAPGGGGAGGTIVVKATKLSGVMLHADGGTGGNQVLSNHDEAEGPGGGGGGGFIATAGGTVVQTATGKLGGTTNSEALKGFPSNGATGGAAGQTGIAAVNMPICPASDDDIGVSGGGCSAGGSGLGLGAASVLVALGLLRRRRAVVVRLRRRRTVVAGVVVAAAVLPRLAAAQTPVMEPKDFGVERFQLASGRDSLFDVEWAEVRGDMAVTAALWTGLANDPLVIYKGGPNNRVGSLVANRMDGSLSASVSPTRWLQLGFDLPLVGYQSRPDTSVLGTMQSLNSFGTGNLRLVPKLVALHQADHGVSLAFVPTLIVPTHSTSDAYFDDRGFGFAPEVVVSRRWIGWRASVDAGYHARQRAQFLNQVVDDELFTHVGAGYQFADRGGPPVGVDLTLSGATAARAPLQNFNEDHLETLAGATYDVTSDAQLFAGAGVGLRKGYGTPDWRVLVGVRVGFARSHERVVPPPPPPPAPPPPAPPPPPPAPVVEPPPPPAPVVEPPPPPPPAPAPPPPPVVVNKCTLDLNESIHFKTDRAEIESSSFGLLDSAVDVLTVNDKLNIQIEGHTDNQGSAAYNKGLSQRRADAVVAYLVKKGIAKSRLSGRGFGLEKPIADNNTVEGRAQNRRVVFAIQGCEGAGDDAK